MGFMNIFHEKVEISKKKNTTIHLIVERFDHEKHKC